MSAVYAVSQTQLVSRSSKPAKCGVGEKPAAKPEVSSDQFAQAKSRRELQLHLVRTISSCRFRRVFTPSQLFGQSETFVGADSYLPKMSVGQDAVVGIIGMGDMGKMYARRIAAAGWR